MAASHQVLNGLGRVTPTSDQQSDTQADEGKDILDSNNLTIAKRRFQSGLRTIRESPETVHRVSYSVAMQEEEALLVPQLEPAFPGASLVTVQYIEENPDHLEKLETEDNPGQSEKLDIVEIPDQSEKFAEIDENPDQSEKLESNEEEVSELRLLNERADKLSQELKLLSSSRESSLPTETLPTSINEIMRQYSDFIIIVEGEDGNQQTLFENNEDNFTVKNLADEEEGKNDVIDSALDIPIEVKAEDLLEENTTMKVKAVSDDSKLSQDTFNQNDSENCLTLLEQPLNTIEAETKSGSGDDLTALMVEQDVKMEKSASTEGPENCPASETKIAEDAKVSDCESEAAALANAEGLVGPNQSSWNTDESQPMDEQSDEVSTRSVSLERPESQLPRKPRIRLPMPQFPDLCLEGEKMARLRSYGAYHYWRMPFR